MEELKHFVKLDYGTTSAPVGYIDWKSSLTEITILYGRKPAEFALAAMFKTKHIPSAGAKFLISQLNSTLKYVSGNI